MMFQDNGTEHHALANASLLYMNADYLTLAQHSMLSPISSTTLSSQVFNVTLEKNELPTYWDPPANGQNAVSMVLLVLVLVAIIVVTIVGNILVCVAVCLVKKLRRPYNYLLVSLAVSDMCVAILVMPMALLYELLGEWRFGRIVCDVWVSFDVLSCTASILNLCMISVDRYLAITRPLEYGVKRTPRRMFAYIVFVWLGAAFVSVPPVLILGNEHGDGSICIVCQNFWYQIYATFGSFYIPLTVMVIVYLKIFQAAQRIVNEERKAQAHLKLVAELSRARDNNIRPAAAVVREYTFSKNQPSQVVASRCSVVQINNGEVETKLASYLPLDGTSPEGEWLPDAVNTLLQKNLNHTNHQRHPSDKECACPQQYEGTQQKLLEVPSNDTRHVGSMSPVSTTTSCESAWSLNQKDDARSEVVSVTLNPSFDDKVTDPECQLMTTKEKNELNILNRTAPELDKNRRFSEKCRGELRHLAYDHNVSSCNVIVNSLREKGNFEEPKTNSLMAITTEVSPPLESYGHHSSRVAVHRNESDASSQALLSKSQDDKEKRSSSPRRKFFIPPKSKLRITLAKERKASTTLGIIMSAFIVCWLPFFVLAIVRPFLSDPTAIPNSISSLFLWLGYANSLLNPIIYATLNKDFRKPFQEILCLRCSSLNLLMREEFYHSQYGPDTPNHSHVRYSTTIRDQIDNFAVPTYDDKYTSHPDIISESRF